MSKKAKIGKGIEVPQPATEWDPFGASKRTERLLEMPMGFARMAETLPRVDLVDEGDRFRIKADLPGVRKEGISLIVWKNVVTISASAGTDREERRKGYYYRERSASGYYRSIPLPQPVDGKSAKAKFTNGTLEMTIKKSKRQSAAKVSVKVE